MPTMWLIVHVHDCDISLATQSFKRALVMNLVVRLTFLTVHAIDLEMRKF